MDDSDAWLVKHPYLQPIADLDALVGTIVNEVVLPSTSIPVWENYVEDFDAGVPMLYSPRAVVDLRPVEWMLASLVQELTVHPLPTKLAEQSRALASELDADPDCRHRVLNWLLGKCTFSTGQSGLLQHLGWNVIARYLRHVVVAFANWREEERWLRNYCPTCGFPPAMAQLVGSDPGRLRLLSCGYCGTRWRYRRSQCPFCETDDHRLMALDVDDNRLRIDYCQNCGGYLKTYNGEGNEAVLLADWTSLHLDLIACDRGLKRFAGSLYQL